MKEKIRRNYDEIDKPINILSLKGLRMHSKNDFIVLSDLIKDIIE
jgi:hypothetical protein